VPCPGAPGTCAYDPNARFVINGKNDAPTGRAALSYTFDNNLLTYVSYNRGYRAGAFNGGGYTSSSGITYIKPETVNAYETGVKGRLFDKTLTLAAAGFYYDYSNQQLQDTRPGPVSFLVNAPKSKIYGVETEATWHVVPDFTLRGSFVISMQRTPSCFFRIPISRAKQASLRADVDWASGIRLDLRTRRRRRGGSISANRRELIERSNQSIDHEAINQRHPRQGTGCRAESEADGGGCAAGGSLWAPIKLPRANLESWKPTCELGKWCLERISSTRAGASGAGVAIDWLVVDR